MTWGARLSGIHMAVYDTSIYNYQIYSNSLGVNLTNNLYVKIYNKYLVMMLHNIFFHFYLALEMQFNFVSFEKKLLLTGIAALAIGDTATAKGYLCKLQPGLELHKPGTKPEPRWS